MSPQLLDQINRDFEERETMKKAAQMGLGYVDFRKFVLNPDVVRLLEKNKAQAGELIPLSLNGVHLKVAAHEPEMHTTQALLKTLKSHYSVDVFLCSRSGIVQALNIYDTDLLTKKIITPNDRKTPPLPPLHFSETLVKEWTDTFQHLPAAQALHKLKTVALRLRATDIHLQPFQDHILLRLRIDGILHDFVTIPPAQAQQIITRIKYESGMRSNISNVPQDGHMSFSFEDRTIDFRVSTVPSNTFESVVIRILDAQHGIKSLYDLGFLEQDQEIIIAQSQKSQGLILVTGPTGSGKTTTLYATLKQIKNHERKIVTLEDPIEYKLDGISQSQINPEKGYTFETGFEALLRHDPDVMLVGEIRNTQTAHLATESAMTGHMVLSTLHTNSAVEAITRLRNFGLEDYNIGPALNLIIAQRLVRKIQPTKIHSGPLPLDDERFARSIQRLQKILPDLRLPTEIPLHTEASDIYEGRQAIAELLVVDAHIQRLIVDQKPTLDIHEYLLKKTDFLSLFDHGVLAVLKGETTLHEVYRVVG